MGNEPKDGESGVNRARTPIDTSEPSEIVAKYIEEMRAFIKGQARAIDFLADRVEIDEADLWKPGAPNAKGVFAGPPGVGKTETAYAHSKCWIGQQERDSDGLPLDPVTNIDCTMYVDRWDVSNLVGASKGYVGYEDPTPLHQDLMDKYAREVLFQQMSDMFLGEKIEKFPNMKRHVLTPSERAKVRKSLDEHKPFKKVALFDEIEKAHRSLWHILMTIMNGKTFEFSDGKKTSFERTSLIMTTNVSDEQIKKLTQGGIGFKGDNWDEVDSDKLSEMIYKLTLREMEKTFPGPFMSRVRKNIVVFRALTDKDFAEILDLRIEEIAARYRREYGKMLPGLVFVYTPEARKLLFKKGIDRKYGARPLEDAIEKYILVPLSRLLNRRRKDGDLVKEGDTLVFDAERPAGAPKGSEKIVVFRER